MAAHGRDERAILRAALEAGVPYVGLVASRKRGAAVLDALREDGVSEELLERIDTPAGLDIGARTPAEIALSILASDRSRYAGGRARPRARGRPPRPPRPASIHPATAIDPICGMTVARRRRTRSTLEHAGETYYFCGEGCQRAFERAHATA